VEHQQDGLGEDQGVPVGGGQVADYSFASLQQYAADLDVLGAASSS
jgi:hypothetical protein